MGARLPARHRTLSPVVPAHMGDLLHRSLPVLPLCGILSVHGRRILAALPQPVLSHRCVVPPIWWTPSAPLKLMLGVTPANPRLHEGRRGGDEGTAPLHAHHQIRLCTSLQTFSANARTELDSRSPGLNGGASGCRTPRSSARCPVELNLEGVWQIRGCR